MGAPEGGAAIQLAGELGRPADVLESADKYLTLFPTSPKVNEVRQTRTAAALQVAAEAAAPAAAPAAQKAP